MLLLGWDMRQWGAAKAYHKRTLGVEAPVSTDGAFNVQDWWKLRRLDEPLESTIEGVKPEVDLRWAYELFLLRDWYHYPR